MDITQPLQYQWQQLDSAFLRQLAQQDPDSHAWLLHARERRGRSRCIRCLSFGGGPCFGAPFAAGWLPAYDAPRWSPKEITIAKFGAELVRKRAWRRRHETMTEQAFSHAWFDLQPAFAAADISVVHWHDPACESRQLAALWQWAVDTDNLSAQAAIETWVVGSLVTAAGRQYCGHWQSMWRADLRSGMHDMGELATQRYGYARTGLDYHASALPASAMMTQLYHCKLCHVRGSDTCAARACSKETASYRRDLKARPLMGCPLNLKISQMLTAMQQSRVGGHGHCHD